MYSRLKILLLELWYELDPAGRLRRSGAIVGSNVFFGLHTSVELENAKLLYIEDGVVLSAFTKIILHDSSLHNVIGSSIRYGEVTLKRKCYIGANTLILPGSTVGEGTIVGANSLVKGRLKPHSVYVGQPAHYLCSVDELAQKWKKNKL